MAAETSAQERADVTRALKLTDEQKRTVVAIVASAASGCQVFVFGSRASSRARPFSDLDLLLERHEPLTLDERARLRDAFEASDLPFRVDVVDAHDLAPGFAERVRAERIRLD